MSAFTSLLYFQLIETDWVKDIVILVMIYILAFLMVSNIRYFSFKELNLAKRKPFSILIFVVLSLTVIVMEPVVVLSAFILLYVFSGPVNMVWGWRKKKALGKMEPIPQEDRVIRG
jgi:CDP-diacylglycerol--serine O-phosphatidyltransferase